MKKIGTLLIMLLSINAFSQEHRIIPAGSLLGCTISESHLNSKTAKIGDPVLCKLSFSERHGRSTMPYDSYLEGRFEEYQTPGHFAGKGWMLLVFDRMLIEPNIVLPIDAKVVDVPGYNVANDGRIIGKGHEKRDIALWSIPILWPIDLLMLPMRGPSPTLREETRLTVKVMDDLALPIESNEPNTDQYGLHHRQANNQEYSEPEQYHHNAQFNQSPRQDNSQVYYPQQNYPQQPAYPQPMYYPQPVQMMPIYYYPVPMPVYYYPMPMYGMR
jgi:hypothetical protein